MKDVTINNYSVTTGINWDSPEQTKASVQPVITHSYSDGTNRSVQHGSVAGRAVKTEQTPDGVGSSLAAAGRVPRALFLPSHCLTTPPLLHGEKNAFHRLVPHTASCGSRGGNSTD